MKYKIKNLLWRHRHWRSTAWNRGYYAAMKKRPEHDARQEAWVNFLQRYYYEHQNHHVDGKVKSNG